MIKEIKKSFGMLNENPAIILFFVLYLILVNLFTGYALYLQGNTARYIYLILLLCGFLLSVLFFGGWMEMFNHVIKNDKKSMVGIFFDGAGKHIFSSFIFFVPYFILSCIVIYLSTYVASKIFGDTTQIYNSFAAASASGQNALENLSPENLKAFFGTYLVILSAYCIFLFLVMFLPATFVQKETNNPFVRTWHAYIENFKFIFKNFWHSVLLFLFICSGLVIVALISVIGEKFPFLNIVNLFIHIYFISYVVMLIFNCYETKTACTDRADCIGENETCDSTGEEE